jgi:hypothetical protein
MKQLERTTLKSGKGSDRNRSIRPVRSESAAKSNPDKPEMADSNRKSENGASLKRGNKENNFGGKLNSEAKKSSGGEPYYKTPRCLFYKTVCH